MGVMSFTMLAPCTGGAFAGSSRFEARASTEPRLLDASPRMGHHIPMGHPILMGHPTPPSSDASTHGRGRDAQRHSVGSTQASSAERADRRLGCSGDGGSQSWMIEICAKGCAKIPNLRRSAICGCKQALAKRRRAIPISHAATRHGFHLHLQA